MTTAWRGWLFLLPLLGCAVAAATAADEAPTAVDEQTLRSANIGTDGPTLLGLLRRQSLPPERIKELIRQLGADDFDVRERASGELAQQEDAALSELRQARSSSDPEVASRAKEILNRADLHRGHRLALRLAAVRLLRDRKPADAFGVLLASVPAMADGGLLEEMVQTLTSLARGNAAAVKELAAALADSTPARRAAAADVLTRLGDTDHRPAVVRLLKDPESLVRLRVGIALAHAGEREAVPVLIALLADLPQAQGWQAESVLLRLAGVAAPSAPLARDSAARQAARDTWADWWRDHGAKVDLKTLEGAPRFLGFTLVVLLDLGSVADLDTDGAVRWRIDGLELPLDAQLLPGERVLVAEHGGNRVTERNVRGDVLWQRAVEEPLAAQRLSNGHTFIASKARLLEVDRDGKEVFGLPAPGGESFMRGHRLPSGDILAVLNVNLSQILVVYNAQGKEKKRFPVNVHTSGGRLEVLPDGGVLIPENHTNLVVQYDVDGRIVRRLPTNSPIAVSRLPNGHLLVTSMGMRKAMELDRNGREVWEYRHSSDIRVSRAWRR